METQIALRKTRLSALAFMKNGPHFVTWTVKGVNRTGTVCYPEDDQPFDLGQVFGIVDASGVFHSTDCSALYADGCPVHSVRIERDNDPK